MSGLTQHDIMIAKRRLLDSTRYTRAAESGRIIIHLVNDGELRSNTSRIAWAATFLMLHSGLRETQMKFFVSEKTIDWALAHGDLETVQTHINGLTSADLENLLLANRSVQTRS